MPACGAHVKGRLGVEGSCVGIPAKRQTPTWGRGVWPVRTPSCFGMTCKMRVAEAPAFAAESVLDKMASGVIFVHGPCAALQQCRTSPLCAIGTAGWPSIYAAIGQGRPALAKSFSLGILRGGTGYGLDIRRLQVVLSSTSELVQRIPCISDGSRLGHGQARGGRQRLLGGLLPHQQAIAPDMVGHGHRAVGDGPCREIDAVIGGRQYDDDIHDLVTVSVCFLLARRARPGHTQAHRLHPLAPSACSICSLIDGMGRPWPLRGRRRLILSIWYKFTSNPIPCLAQPTTMSPEGQIRY